MNSDTSTRMHAKDAKRAVKNLGVIPRLTDDDIHAAISYVEGKEESLANVGIMILLIVIVIAFVTLFFRVANS